MRRTDLTEHTDYTDKKFQNLSSAGPIPSGNYFLNLSSNMHYEKTGGGWGIGGWSIYPTNPIIRRAGFIEMKLGWDLPWVRSGFFLHEDGNRDGTAGCIGLSMRGIRDLKAHLQVYYAKTKAATMLIVVDYEA